MYTPSSQAVYVMRGFAAERPRVFVQCIVY